MTARLCQTALAEWAYIDGYAVSQGIDLLDMPLARFTNFIWFLMTREQEKPAVEKMRAKLWMPPKGEAAPKGSPWSPEKEYAAVQALKVQLGGAGTATPTAKPNP